MRCSVSGATPRCVDLAFVGSFFVLRLVLLPLWWVRFLLHGWRSDAGSCGSCMNYGVLAACLLGGVALHSLNLYWFWHILRRVAAKVGGEPVREGGVAADDAPDKLS